MRYSNEKKECGGGIHLLAVCCGFMGSVCSSDVLCERQMQTAAGSVLEKHRYVIPNELKQEKPELPEEPVQLVSRSVHASTEDPFFWLSSS